MYFTSFRCNFNNTNICDLAHTVLIASNTLFFLFSLLLPTLSATLSRSATPPRSNALLPTSLILHYILPTAPLYISAMWSRCLLAVLCGACVWSTVTRAQVLDSPRPQPLQLTAPLTSQCCGLRGQLLFQCLTNATTGEDAARAREDAEVSLFTYLTPNILSYAALTSAVNAIYAEANGYRFDIILQDENNSYEPRDPR
jgi:hypothetical protein